MLKTDDITNMNKMVLMRYSILSKFITNKLTLQLQKQYPLGNVKVTNDNKHIISFTRLLRMSIKLRRVAAEQQQALDFKEHAYTLRAHSCSFYRRDRLSS